MLNTCDFLTGINIQMSLSTGAGHSYYRVAAAVDKHGCVHSCWSVSADDSRLEPIPIRTSESTALLDSIKRPRSAEINP